METRTFAKAILVLINITYILIGSSLILVGLFVVADTLVVALVLVGIGVFTFLIAIFGIIATAGDFFPLLTIYLFVMTILLVLQSMGNILCFVHKDEIRRNAENKFTEYISRYRDDSSGEYNEQVNEMVDALQHTLHCCGLNGPKDWVIENCDYVSQYGFPDSCRCDADYHNCTTNDLNIYDSIWSKGCYESFYYFVEKNIIYIAGLFLGIVTIQMIGLVITFTHLCTLLN